MQNGITYFIQKSTDKYGNSTYMVMEKTPYLQGFEVDEYNGVKYAHIYQAEQIVKYLNKKYSK